MRFNFLHVFKSVLLVICLGVTTLNAQTTDSSKPFLIQNKLPHLSGTIKILWDDVDLALSEKQKEKLVEIRKNTLKQIKNLSKEIKKLESKIVESSLSGEKPKNLQKQMYELAKLKAEASMIHLKCIYDTRKVLSKEQLEIIE